MSGYTVRIGYPRAKKFSFSGCPGIIETGAVSTVGMLLYAREDRHLNCIEELPAVPETSVPENAPEPAGTPEPEKVSGSVLDQTAWEVRKPEKTRAPKNSKENMLFKWIKKQTQNVVKSGEDFVGGLYDKIEDN
jgi:hypothetical protein